MKTKDFLSAMVLCASLFVSCQDEGSSQDGGTELSVAPTLQAAESRAADSDGFTPKKNWSPHDRMGLFIYKHTGWGEAYDRFTAQNVCSTFREGAWSQEVPVYLSTVKASVWAYYPYSADRTDGTSIPVPIGDGRMDYMWGRSTHDVSASEPRADIPMHHALSQFVLRLKIADNYIKEGKLSAVRLVASEPLFSLDGTMDISRNGLITYEPTLRELSWTPSAGLAGKDLDYAATLYPVSLPDRRVSLEIVLDGETWRFHLPEAVWSAGNRHIYTVTAKHNDLVLDSEDGKPVEIRPWDDTNLDLELEGK